MAKAEKTTGMSPDTLLHTELHNHLNITNHQLRFCIITNNRVHWFTPRVFL